MQGWSPGLPHCRRILFQLRHKGSPISLKPQWGFSSEERMADWANKLARFFAPHGRNPGLGYWQIGLFVCLFVFSFCWWEFPWWLREPAFNAVDPGSVPGEDSPKKRMVTHCSILAWWIPWTEEPDSFWLDTTERLSEREPPGKRRTLSAWSCISVTRVIVFWAVLCFL